MAENQYCEIEPEDYWIPKDGESGEECSNRIHERLKAEYGDSWDEPDEDVNEMLREFDEFLKNESV